MDGAFDLLADNFMRGRRPNVAGRDRGGRRDPREGDRYRRRRFVPWNVADDEGKLVLIGPGGDLDFKRRGWRRARRRPVRRAVRPPTSKCEEPAELIRTLWAGGYLERLDPEERSVWTAAPGLRGSAMLRTASTSAKSPAARATRSPSSQSPRADDLADPFAERPALL